MQHPAPTLMTFFQSLLYRGVTSHMPFRVRIATQSVNLFLLTLIPICLSCILGQIWAQPRSLTGLAIGLGSLALACTVYFSKRESYSLATRFMLLHTFLLVVYFAGASFHFAGVFSSAFFLHIFFPFLFFSPQESKARYFSMGLATLAFLLYLIEVPIFTADLAVNSIPAFFLWLIPFTSFVMMGANIWYVNREQELYAKEQEEKTSLLQEAQAIARLGNWSYYCADERWVWSEELRALFQFPAELAVTTDEYYGRIHPSDRQHVKQSLEKAIEKQEYLRIEHRFYTAKQEERYLLSICQPVKDESGKVYLIRGIMQDITEQKRAEQALIQAKEIAEAATKAKTDFLSAMTHEIRTPLTAVLGMAEFLTETRMSNQQERYVQTIQSAGENLLFVINNILDHSKIESGKIELEKIAFSTQEPVEDTVDLMGTQARSKGLILLSEVGPDVPKVIEGDLGRIRQVLVNLVGNAIKFTQEGEVMIRLQRTAVKGNSHQLTFSVQDTGIGISSTALTQIFESFSQAETSTSRKYGGSGLGLSICRQLVSLMGGKIWAESTQEVGTTFWFQIWVQAAELPHSADLNGKFSLKNPAQTVRRERKQDFQILVVEDHDINQMVILNLLKKLGYEADLAENGLVAVQKVKKQRYDLILMDVQMPEMDGLEATREIRRYLNQHKQPQPAVVALTASALAQERTRCLQSGMNDFLTKPVKVETLASTINQWFLPEVVS